MFTIIVCLALGFIGWFAKREQKQDTDNAAINIRHSRQDLRLIAYLLTGILVMLGVIADRIH